jgi:hypothetical protein
MVILHTIKIFYFTLELSKEEKMLACFCTYSFIKNCTNRFAPTHAKKKSLTFEVLETISKYQKYF